ncbi:MAG: BspA family leucine-rich repeat surface protein, partial [Bacilli bacterium]
MSNWDVSNIGRFERSFFNCSSLTNLDLSNWDVSNVTNMGNMFFNCSSLTNLDLSNWDLKKYNGNTYRTFANCRKLKYLNLSNWKVYAPLDLDNTFNGCTNLKYMDMSNWKISRLYRVFWYCDNLECIKLPNINNIDCGGMLNFTPKLKRIYFLNNSKEGLLKLN